MSMKYRATIEIYWIFFALKQSRTMMHWTRVGSFDEYLHIALKFERDQAVQCHL